MGLGCVLMHIVTIMKEFPTFEWLWLLTFLLLDKQVHTAGPRIVHIQTVRFHYSVVNILVQKDSILL